MDKETITELKAFRKKFHLGRLGWDVVIDVILNIGAALDRPAPMGNIHIELSPAEEDKVRRLCGFMADMIAKYGKEEVINKIKNAA